MGSSSSTARRRKSSTSLLDLVLEQRVNPTFDRLGNTDIGGPSTHRIGVQTSLSDYCLQRQCAPILDPVVAPKSQLKSVTKKRPIKKVNALPPLQVRSNVSEEKASRILPFHEYKKWFTTVRRSGRVTLTPVTPLNHVRCQTATFKIKRIPKGSLTDLKEEVVDEESERPHTPSSMFASMDSGLYNGRRSSESNDSGVFDLSALSAALIRSRNKVRPLVVKTHLKPCNWSVDEEMPLPSRSRSLLSLARPSKNKVLTAKPNAVA